MSAMLGSDLPGGSYLETASRARSTKSAGATRTPAFRLENTYQLEPSVKFSVVETKKIIHEILETNLADRKYHPQEARIMSRDLADIIRERAKASCGVGHRYKLVASVVIGEKSGGSAAMVSRCLWNDKFDSFAEVTFHNDSLFATGIVYALYYE